MRLKTGLVGIAVLALMALPGAMAASATPAGSPPGVAGQQRTSTIVLPGASGAEGIAKGFGGTFYAGDLFTGDIFRGNVIAGKAAKFIDAPEGRMAVGMVLDPFRGLLFVAGGGTGQAYVYDVRTGTEVATVQLGTPPSTFINDVIIFRGAAWFTDSSQPVLYRVPIGPGRQIGTPEVLPLSGPAADTSGAFNLNGIVSPDGKTLLVAHTELAAIMAVDPATGSSRTVAAGLPGADGIEWELGRLLVTQNSANQVAVVKFGPRLTNGRIERVITSDQFHRPATLVRFGGHLAVVNTHFDTGFPPTSPTFEVVLVPLF
jgi:sugar lactone lactonase YvrE